MATYKTEEVVKGENAIWPWMPDYKQPTKSGYDFVGWEYNGTTYTPPFSGSPMASPFGPINGNAEIYAIWKKHADTYYEVKWVDGDFPELPNPYTIVVTTDSHIIANEGDGLTITAEFYKDGASYIAPYSSIFKRTGTNTYTKIKDEQNSNYISYTGNAEHDVIDYVVVINDEQIDNVDYNLAIKFIHAVISQGSSQYSIDIISPESTSITYNIGDEIPISVEFKKDGALYSFPYVSIFACIVNGNYIRVADEVDTNNISYTDWVTSATIDGFYIVASNELIDNIDSPKILVKKLIYAEFNPNE